MKPLARIGLLTGLAGALAALIVAIGSATPPGTNGLLLFQRQVGSVTQLFTMAPDGTGLRQVTRGPHISEDAAWAPDGKTIAFSREFPTHAPILLMHADGRNARTLTPDGLQTFPAFTPDGRWIVYMRTPANDPNDQSLWVMDLTGTHQRQLTHSPRLPQPYAQFPADETPAVSPDGKLVAFARALSETRSALFVVGFDGHGLRRLTPWSTAAVGKLDWAPDGSRILFHTNGQKSQIHTIRSDGTGLTTLTSGARNYCSGSFSPDGTQILLIDHCTSNTQLYSMSSEGGTLTPVPNGADVHRASWGPTVG